MRRGLIATVLASGLATLFGGVAQAQDVEREEGYAGMEERYPEPESSLRHVPDAVFLEAAGAWGVQFGETLYLPAGAVGDWQHPLVTGPSVGGTAGVMLADNVALFASYDYTWAQSRGGSIDGAVDRVEGTIDYHTAVAGLRLYVPLGFGALRAELGAGVLFPYHTTVELDYAANLSQLPSPITGTGRQIDYYSVGFGGQAALGYQLPLVDGLYASVNVRYRLFESENSGEQTVLENYVVDFEALPPAAVDATIDYGDGAAQPSTNSVQDVRLQLALGYQF